MSDALRDALSKAVEAVAPDHVLSRCHPGTIAMQEGQTVGLIIEDGGPVPNASSNRLVYGLPGVACSIKTGERVRMHYENGDPRRPIACGFDPFVRDNELPVQNPPVTEINFCGAASNQGAARNGDPTGNGALIFRQVPIGPGGVPSTLAITYRDASGVEVPALVFPIPGPAIMFALDPQVPDPSTAVVPISGTITGGSAIVKIGG